MLKDLTRQHSTLHIAGKEYRIRYSLNALLCLEVTYKPLSEILQTDWQHWTINDVLHLCHAAMCSLPWNRKAVNARNFAAVKPDLAWLGEHIDIAALPLLRMELVAAVSQSMPQSRGNSDQPDNPLAELQLRAFYCDVMHRPEKELFDSTYKEIADRSDAYLIAKGLKQPPQIVKMLDD